MKLGIISLGGKSSKDVAEACKKFFKKVDLLDLREFEVHITNEGLKVTHESKDLKNYDCLYVRGSHRYSILQRAITRTFSKKVYMPIEAESFTIGHDKFLNLLEMQKKKIRIPKTHYATTPKLARQILKEEVKYPVIIKSQQGTHGKGVLIADSLKSANTILDMLDVHKESYLIQEFVKTKNTSDIRAIVLGKRVVAAYKRKAAKGEIRTNIHSGGTRQSHELTDEQKKLAIKSAESLGAQICGVDILDSDEPSVIEVNLSPSLHSAKEVSGVDVPKKVAQYLFKKTEEFKISKTKMPPLPPSGPKKLKDFR